MSAPFKATKKLAIRSLPSDRNQLALRVTSLWDVVCEHAILCLLHLLAAIAVQGYSA